MKYQLHSNDDLSSRLTTYAASAGAFMAIGFSSQAQVVHSGEQNLTLNFPDDSMAIDLNGDMVNDFAILLSSSIYSSIYGSYASYRDAGLAAIINLKTDSYKNSWITELSTINFQAYEGNYYTWILPLAGGLKFGDMVEPVDNDWRNASSLMTYGIMGASSYFKSVDPYDSFSVSLQAGKFVGEEKFLGVRFYIGDNLHYGWIRISMPEEIAPLTIIDWAYEQTPDMAIQAGQGLGEDMPPSFIFSRTGTATNPNSTITLTATETITGFTLDDIVPINGTITNFTEVTSGEIFTMDVEAQEEGQIILEIEQGAFTDIAANENNIITLNWPYDITGPIPVFEIFDSVTSWPNVTIYLYFDEPVTELDASDFILTNCSVEDISNWQNPFGTTYIIWVIASSEGTVTVELPAGATQDNAGNPSLAASASWMYDDSTPQIYFSVISEEVSEAKQTLTISFSEEIQDFTINNLEVFNGTASNLVEITPGLEYQVDITADDFGYITVVLPEYTIFDLAGNPTPGDGISWKYIEANSVDNHIAKEISIFPNPANDRLTIELSDKGALRIMDLQGKTILSKEQVLQETFDISNLNSGIYIIQVNIKGNTSTHRLIVE